ncbi:hypothetical protein [Paenimyroides viscosum]|uniref:DUF695 domain-containing protein n=1 Tax=Paenimyroides viscosum TaxID=2488729 RepID=A0A3P1ATK9_9FLAO|nr:hypothetical protein [Paenimyroides viscosum]RRA92268.1 hypothetical protein EG242_11690 [Paenimyroides viscosum]
MAFFSFKKENKEDKFWNWFIKNEEYIYKNVDNLELRDAIFDDITEHFQEIDENLTFEFSPIHENGIREFSISADGIEESFSAVNKMISKSPKLKNWQFNSFRQRIPGDELTINYGDYKIGYDDIYFTYSTENDELGIELFTRNFDDSGEMKNVIYILLDGLIGEYDVTVNINWIEWKKLEEKNIQNLQPLTDLRKVIDHRKKLN